MTEIERKIWFNLIESQKKISHDWYHIDLSTLSNKVTFKDIIHVTQNSRKLIANQIEKLVKEVYLNNC